MAKKQISETRRKFRKVLYGIAALSFVFFSLSVALKVNRSANWYVAKNYGESIFAVDVFKSQTLAYWQDDNEKHETATKLINNGVFSKQYGLAGLEMMKNLADSGHPPSQTVYGDVLMRKPTEENRKKARYYYHLAANENYAPALERIEKDH